MIRERNYYSHVMELWLKLTRDGYVENYVTFMAGGRMAIKLAIEMDRNNAN